MSGETKTCTCGPHVGCPPDPLCPVHTREAYDKAREPYEKTPEPKPYTDRDLIELACRAPACPEWFQPDMQGAQEPTPEQQRLAADRELGHFISKKEPGLELEYKGSLRIVRQWQMEKSIRKIAQWPKAYARMVLESK